MREIERKIERERESNIYFLQSKAVYLFWFYWWQNQDSPQLRGKQSECEESEGKEGWYVPRAMGHPDTDSILVSFLFCSGPEFQENSEPQTHLHLSHLGGVEGFICVIFPMHSPSN